MSASRELPDPSAEAVFKGIIAAEAAEHLEARPMPEFVSYAAFYNKVFGKTQDRKKLRMVKTPPQQGHTERLKRGYVSPSRRGLVPVTAHVPPELRQALHEKYQQSGVPSFNEFMTSLLQRTIDDPAQHDTSATLAEAVEHTRALQKTISTLALDLSNRRSR
jgi:hypothetical protein